MQRSLGCPFVGSLSVLDVELLELFLSLRGGLGGGFRLGSKLSWSKVFEQWLRKRAGCWVRRVDRRGRLRIAFAWRGVGLGLRLLLGREDALFL